MEVTFPSERINGDGRIGGGRYPAVVLLLLLAQSSRHHGVDSACEWTKFWLHPRPEGLTDPKTPCYAPHLRVYQLRMYRDQSIARDRVCGVTTICSLRD